ncbi:MAG: antitoxin VapB [Clostridia bacterium]|jgi:Xaa-Pro aminopeptidase|nr:antitoxin VapB [Clostridia bacterium]
MNSPQKSDIQTKWQKVKDYLQKSGYEAMILGRHDNFAWFTDGGNNRVILSTDNGFGVLVITQTQVYLVAQVMDGRRIMEEELPGIDFIEYIPLHWFEESREEKALQLAGTGRVISDINIKGTDYLPNSIFELHYPMTSREIEKMRWLGKTTDAILTHVAQEIRLGMSEYEVESMLISEYTKQNIYCDVLLIGTDDRIAKYRHFNPTDRKIGKYVVLHPAVKKWGLHANVTRTVFFGDDIPADIVRKYDAACQVEAAAISMCDEGNRFSDILKEQKELYKQLGFEEEWKYHYQGGITGYIVGDGSLCKDPQNVICSPQAFDWFITITGVKVEELTINYEGKQEIVSASGCWNTKEFSHRGRRYALPYIMQR